RTMTQIRGLGYLKVQTTDIARWRELTVDCLAMQEVDGPYAGALHLRMDERSARLVVVPGKVDKVLAVGWEVRDQFALAAVGRAVEASGRSVRVLEQGECDERRIEAGMAFEDPAGTPLEVFFGPVLD